MSLCSTALMSFNFRLQHILNFTFWIFSTNINWFWDYFNILPLNLPRVLLDSTFLFQIKMTVIIVNFRPHTMHIYILELNLVIRNRRMQNAFYRVEWKPCISEPCCWFEKWCIRYWSLIFSLPQINAASALVTFREFYDHWYKLPYSYNSWLPEFQMISLY